jgi:hypothetical protein
MPDEEVVVDPVEEEVDPVEESTEDPDEVDEPQEEEMPEAELREAKNLYKLLKDKSQQKNVIRILAQQAGLLGENAPETKKEVTAAKKDLKGIIKDKLGPEYAFLVEKLGDTLEAVLEQERQTTLEVLNSVQQQKVETETSAALSRLSRETKGDSLKVESKMIALMDRIKPSENLSVYEYLKDLYTLASSGKSAASAANRIADKIRRNAGNAADRLNSKGSGKEGKPTGPEKKGLRASIEYAVQQMNIKD